MTFPAASPEPVEWLPSLDALVAAPDQHKMLFENEKVRVLETRIMPGERTPVHTHQWAGVLYILSWSPFVRRDDQGNVLVDTRTAQAPTTPHTVWSPALPPHSFENVGVVDFHTIAVELKDS